MTKRSSEPTAEERALFERAMADVRPLAKAAAKAEPPSPPPRPSPAGAGQGEQRLRRTGEGTGGPALPAPTPAKRGRVGAGTPVAAPPPAPGIDKATLAKLTRGEIAIDRRLDLHGMTQTEAHRSLDRSLAAAVSGGARLVLVITGKGAGGDGVLRRALPGWIAAGPHAARVLRIVPARPKHGGAGAWYVYLRRRREA